MLEHLFADLNPKLLDVLNTALKGKALSPADAEVLMKAKDKELLALILAANEVRHKRVGDTVTFIINRNINYTNICVGACGFCAFRRDPSASDAYLLSEAQIKAKVNDAKKRGATEICIQGGLHPDITIHDYVEMVRWIKNASPNIHVHGFSPMEISYGARKAEISIDEALKMLKDAGLNSLPGTAAEILNDQIRSTICPNKLKTGEWVALVESAHQLGLPTTATMMYGHIESDIDRIKHLTLLRQIQEKTGGFTEFIPLTFMYRNTSLHKKGVDGATGAEDLRVYAVSRLMLQGLIDNIQVSWVKLGPKFAQFALCAGANDVGGTLMEENISRSAGAVSGEYLGPEKIKKLIRDIGRTPAQRTTTYKIIRRWPNAH